jgi:parallel beta-helix repeat protein
MIIIFIILFSSVISVSGNLTLNKDTIYVDDDNINGPWNGTIDYPYKKIQDGINNANDGDTVFVFNGTYYENIIVKKSITIIGENKNCTIIDGIEKDNTVNISSENVSLSDFTITNSNRSIKNWYKAGIRLTGSNNIIFNNIIKENMLGIFGKKVTNITIYNNQFFGDGIVFSIYDSGNDQVFYSNKYFLHNISNNKINNKTLYYFRNQNDMEVPNDAGQIIAVNCNKIIVRDINLDNADFGCILVNCSDCLIEHCSISHSDGMIWIIHSKKNLIQKNRISHNFEGICIDAGSKRNKIRFNNISNNERLGIILEYDSNFNIIFRNNFKNNNPGSILGQASFKYCFYNIFRKNFWNRPRILPMPIFWIKNKIPRWINSDFRPALIPNKTN